ncbi:MAG: ion channel [Rhizobiaceae bacterium]
MSVKKLKSRVEDLYYGKSRQTLFFHIILGAIDIAAIVYFLTTFRVPHVAMYMVIDLIIFTFFAVELFLRFWVDQDQKYFFFRISTIGDLVVLASLVLPLIVENLGFLRILRTMRFLRMFRITDELRRILPLKKREEDVFAATLNLLVFVFVVTSTVWVLEAPINPELNNWVDALYFTVSTLTTTGYGDITLEDPLGRLLTVFIMIFGVALFLRLAQAIFRPHKVSYTCPDCGLTRHDTDASHCKHCGRTIRIETEGDW